MKNNLIIGVLVGLLGLGALISMVLSFRVIVASRELGKHQVAIARVNNDSQVAKNMLNELVALGSTNASVVPLLNDLGLKSVNAAQPANR